MTKSKDDRAGQIIAANRRAIARWLLAIAAMVFAMIVLGGITRLTGSGLSIVDWRPFMGWLPPLSEADWQALFDRYKAFPEYVKINPGMTLAGFQEIFWLEYLHRLWGRLIGLAFLIPFLWFWLRGRIEPGLWSRLAMLFILGGLQGLLGWVMVKSGLVDRPSVSQYRLAAHLALAVLIYGALVWTAWGLGARGQGLGEAPRWLRAYAGIILAMICATLIAGAFVAGLDAGLIYNSFPKMGEGLVPPDLWRPGLGLLNFFENPVAAQFTHRVLAIATLLLVYLFWGASRAARLGPALRLSSSGLMLAANFQAFLGVATLVLYVPVWLGALHQAGALVLLTAGLWVLLVFRAATSRR